MSTCFCRNFGPYEYREVDPYCPSHGWKHRSQAKRHSLLRDALVALWTDRRSDKHAELYAEAMAVLVKRNGESFSQQGGAMGEESSFVTWARSELERAGLFDQDSDYEGMLGTEVMRMVETFSEAGHSGFSAALAASIFARLSAWKALTPITDAPDEWTHIDEGMAGQPNLWQSRRQPSLFSHDGGRTYYDLDEHLPWWRRVAERTLRRRLPVYHEAQSA